MKNRLFTGIYPCGISYADRTRDVSGDYARVAFLNFRTLELTIEKDCPPSLRAEIVQGAARIQARRGADFQISSSGQTVRLGQ